MAIEVASIPFGNVGLVNIEDSNEVACVHFHADPHGGPETLWFCFRVRLTAGAVPRRVELILENCQNLLGGGSPSNFRPVLRRAGGDWKRQAAPDVEMLSDGRLRAKWAVEGDALPFDFAFCFPYGPDELARLLAETGRFYQVSTVGVSQGGRSLQRLSNRFGSEGSRAPGLYVVSRQHSGETPGSWVMDGLLRALAAEADRAPLVWAVPFVNIDGVMGGDYGKDNFPYDLNRAWGQPPMRHETLVLQGDLRRWQARCRPLLALDLHAPGASEAEGLYAYTKEHEPSPAVEETDRWVERFGRALDVEYAAGKFSRVAKYPSRFESPSFTQFAVGVLGIPALTIEVPYALARDTVLTRERYQEAGSRLAKAILEAVRETERGHEAR